MNEYTTSKGIRNGWYWRFIGLTVLSLVVLQVIAAFTLHYPIATSLPLAMMMVIYLVVPRVKERRLANTMVGVAVTFILGFILQLVLQSNYLSPKSPAFWSTNLFTLALGLVMSWVFLRLMDWSDRKRAQLDAKRANEGKRSDASTANHAAVRQHRSKKGRPRNR